MTDLLGNISASIAIVQSLLEIKKGYDYALLKNHISDLYLQLAEVKTKAAELMTENQTLKDKLEEFEKNPLSFDGYVYRDSKDIPYCPGCYGNTGKRVPVTRYYKERFRCPVCDAYYGNQN